MVHKTHVVFTAFIFQRPVKNPTVVHVVRLNLLKLLFVDVCSFLFPEHVEHATPINSIPDVHTIESTVKEYLMDIYVLFRLI